MSALRWTAVPLVVGMLTGTAAVAVADEPAPAPTPEPTPTPTQLAADAMGLVTTITTTTTIVNAPITVVAAPITTTINPMVPDSSTPIGGAIRDMRDRFVMNLTGCRGPGDRSPVAQHDRVRQASVRLARDASLIVRVNGRSVTTLRLPSTAGRHDRGVALRLRLDPSGMLTIRRPSGRVLTIQGCTPA